MNQTSFMLFHQVQKKIIIYQCFISKDTDAINEATIVLAVPFAIYPEYGICFKIGTQRNIHYFT